MRKICILVCLLLGVLSLEAAPKAAPTPVTFFGIDFSAVNVVAQEEESAFIAVFPRINGLLIDEAAKYNVAKWLNVEVLSIRTSTADARVELLRDRAFRNQADAPIDLKQIVSAYPTVAGDALLIVAVELNKPMLTARYQWVIFDGESHEIRESGEVEGKPAGFGLRNYWAGSLPSAFKKAR